MSHTGRKPTTWQTSLLSLTHSCLAALKDSDAGLHGLSIWITQQPVYWSQFVFRYLLWLPPPFGPLSPLWSDNTELNVMMQGHNTHTLADSNIHRQAQRKWRKARKSLTERCILDLNKALQGARKPVFGQEENAKQALHQRLKTQVTESSPAGRAEHRCSQPKQKLL